MAKCTGVRCPMQYGYKVEECNHTDCPYRTEPITNADRIRAMSDEELADWILNGVSTDPCDYCEHNNGYCDGFSCVGKADAETIKEWLKQPAE